ncbi:hypothetical protein [Deinococcus sp. Leaf326]|uniref:hypothetical protein n=1 Tax=Deinococcus sp. Leaf326 TaxID=1736338 RepID=UPI0006FAD3FC|nr:hypothetical protein [Deinococcus sp. Leaf326]KQR15507.1 hypothetical protein ASF71_20295 [Deinococcus sp. Leaf326]
MTARTAKSPKPTRNPFTNSQVLILGEGEATLVSSKGNVRTSQGPDLKTLPAKLSGPVAVIDLTKRTELAYANMAEYTPTEVLGGLMLDASAYTKKDNRELYLNAAPTISDQDQTAALLGYIARSNYAALSQDIQRTGLHMTVLIPALAVAAQALLPDGLGTLLVEVHTDEYTVLLLENGKILGRFREFYRSDTPAQDILKSLDSLAKSDALQEVKRVALMGDATLIQNVLTALQDVAEIEFVTFSPSGLAQLLHQHGTLFAIRGRTEGQAKQVSWWPLVAGVALGLLPYGVLSALNAGTSRQIQQTRDQITAIQPQLAEGRALEAEIARVQDVKTKAAAITESRVDWSQALSDLTDQLPQSAGQLTARFTRLSTDLPAPVAAATPVATTAADGTTTPVVAPIPAASVPLPTYQLEFKAASRAAATALITNLEQTYVLDTQTLTRNPDGSWRIQANATTKPATTESAATAATPETP